MKFGVLSDVRLATVQEHELPELQPDQVLIRNKACNICTTDYQQWLGLRPNQKMNMAFGHENSGVVEAVGSRVKNIAVGDHVVTDAYRPCLTCSSCRNGKNASFCVNPNIDLNAKDAYGYYGLYGCSEYQIVEEKYVFRLRDGIPFEQATFCEPLSTVIHGVELLNLRPGNKVVVIGAGTMGVLNAQVARHSGAFVLVSDISDKKLDTLSGLGFKNIVNPKKNDLEEAVTEFLNGDLLDAVIIAVGVSSAYKQALDISTKGTKLLIFASGHPVPKWELDPNLVHYKMLNVIGTYGCCQKDYLRAAELIGIGAIDVRPLIDKKFPLDKIQDAFTAAATEGAYRVSVSL